MELSETSHWTDRLGIPDCCKPDLRPHGHWLEGGERGGVGGLASCPLCLSHDPKLSQQTLSSPHSKHTPGKEGEWLSLVTGMEKERRKETDGEKKEVKKGREEILREGNSEGTWERARD